MLVRADVGIALQAVGSKVFRGNGGIAGNCLVDRPKNREALGGAGRRN